MADAPVPGWKTTALWVELSGRQGEPAERLTGVLPSALKKIEAVLEGGDSAPGTFTLHDAAHSRRVAERMGELAGTELLSEMDPYDLALLLLAAYLHDIGMTPPVSRLDATFSYLLSGRSEGLDEDERESLQAWLDDEAHGVRPPIGRGKSPLATMREARSLTAQYVRFRHNDWSEDWIRQQLAGLDDETYVGFLFDLILLCKSHHFGIENLRGADFDARLVGSPATVLHLRFDACLLRVADVLDFDPERTPKILYDHRDVSDTSAIFWHKDHELSFVQNDGRISIHARPSSAMIHRAIELSIEDVDRELHLCQRLAEETQFHRMDGRVEDLPHRWRLDANVQPNVKPRNGEYVYIDGTFRPDQEQILELLGGVALYGSPFAAIRELLQNAFDAVREQIAYERLKDEEPGAIETYQRIAANFSVSLEVERAEEGIRIICRDTGVGMSKEIIISRLLVGGSTASHETKALERTCEEKGFSVGRTARFGIGVLSYFLLANQLTIHTRRSSEAGNPDGIGWSFLSHGLTDFGELKKNSAAPDGTTVELLVPKERMRLDYEHFVATLRTYVADVVRKVPCRFSMTSSDFDIEPMKIEPGWLASESELSRHLLSNMNERAPSQPVDSELLSYERRLFIERRQDRWEKVGEEALKALRTTVVEGDLPDQLGTYRLHLGFFEVADMVLLPYLDLTPDDEEYTFIPINGAHAVVPGRRLTTSWRGMKVATETPATHGFRVPLKSEEAGFVIEIDWASDAAGHLAVHRNILMLNEKGVASVEFVKERGRELQSALVEKEGDPRFELINKRAVGLDVEPAPGSLWPEKSFGLLGFDPAVNKPLRLQPLRVPATEDLGNRILLELSWHGAPVTQIPSLVIAGSVGKDHISWHRRRLAPQALGFIHREGQPWPVPIWTKLEGGTLGPRRPLPEVEFPAHWRELLSIEVEGDEPETGNQVWNKDHPLVEAVDLDSWAWVHSTFSSNADPLVHAEELMASPGRIAAWILWCVLRRKEEIWTGLLDRAPDFLLSAWELVPGLGDLEALYTWYEEFGEVTLGIIDPDGWEEYGEPDSRMDFQHLFDPPDERWWLDGAPPND